MSTDDEPQVHTNSIAFAMSREMAVAHGMVEPTYEEKIQHYERMVAWRAECAEARVVYDRAREKIAALDAEEWPIATKILAMHAPSAEMPPTCEGCPPDNEYGQHEWPCPTVTEVCAFPGLHIELPNHHNLYEDFEPVHPDDAPPWRPFRVRDLLPQSFVRLTMGEDT